MVTDDPEKAPPEKRADKTASPSPNDGVSELLRIFDCLWPGEDPEAPSAAMAANVSDDAERRTEQRYTGPALSRLAHSRVHPGIDMQVIDLSSSGALLETRNRFAPHMPVRLILGVRERGDIAVDAVVLRSYVHSISARHVLYRSAIRFLAPIAINEVVA